MIVPRESSLLFFLKRSFSTIHTHYSYVSQYDLKLTYFSFSFYAGTCVSCDVLHVFAAQLVHMAVLNIYSWTP